MRNGSSSPPLAPGIQIGSRPATTPTLRLAANKAPEHQRPLLLREFFDRLGVRYDAQPVHSEPIEIDLTIQALPGLQLLSGRLQGSRYRRTRVGSDPTDDVGLIMNPKGDFLLSQRGQEIVLGDGEATLVSLTDSLESLHRPPGDLLVLRFPRPQIAWRLADARDTFMRRIPQTAPALRLLMNYFNVVREERAVAHLDLQQSIVSHFYELTALAIGATRDAAELAREGGLRAARLHAIKQDIAEHLGQPDLSVASLAVRHGCTPRYIQRLFESEGTSFTEYVLDRRLALAHRMLCDPRRHAEKITAIAFDAGFGDVSYFNRVFRQRYGDTPSGIRALAESARQLAT
jgi:AraC-like DNA-binding protein